MKKSVLFTLIVIIVGLAGCSVQPVGNGTPSGIWVMFDGDPLILDSSVVFMGTVVGQVRSRDWGNGVTRVSIVLDGQYDDLKKDNMAAVVKNGRINLEAMSGYGDSLPQHGCINGFVNRLSYRLFKFTNLTNNITISADRRAQHLLVRSGLAG